MKVVNTVGYGEHFYASSAVKIQKYCSTESPRRAKLAGAWRLLGMKLRATLLPLNC